MREMLEKKNGKYVRITSDDEYSKLSQKKLKEDFPSLTRHVQVRSLIGCLLN